MQKRDWQGERRTAAKRQEAAEDAVSGLRSPPHDAGAERGVLSAMVWSSAARTVALDNLSREHFYLPQHQYIYDAIASLASTNTLQIDATIVKNRLKTMGKLDEALGDAYVDEVITAEVSGVHIGEYVEILVGQSIARAIHYTATEMLADSHAGGRSPLELVDAYGERISKIGSINTLKNDAGGPEDQIFAEMMKAQKDGFFKVDRYATGFPGIDEIIGGGVAPGEMLVIGARPGCGKTAIAENVMSNGASRGDSPCALASIDMPAKIVGERMISNISGVSFRKVQRRLMESDADFKATIDAITAIKKSGTVISDTCGRRPSDLKRFFRRQRDKLGIRVGIIDYLQILSADIGMSSGKLYEKITEISKAVKEIALDLNIALIVLAQLNRGPEGREDQEPHMGDLRDSGQIEQDASAILLMYRENPTSSMIRVRVAKNRNGMTTQGKTNKALVFDGSIFRMREAATVMYGGNMERGISNATE